MSAYSSTGSIFQPALLNASVASPNANKDWELGGVNAADVNSTTGSLGGNLLTTAGASGDQMIVSPHQDANQTTLNSVDLTAKASNLPLVLHFRFELQPSNELTDGTLCFGIRPTVTSLDTTTDDEKVILRAVTDANGDGNLFLTVSNTGVDTTVDTGISLSSAPGQSGLFDITLTIEAGSGATNRARTPFGLVRVSGGPVKPPAEGDSGTSGATGRVNSPGTTNRALVVAEAADLGKPFFGFQADAAAAKSIQLIALDVIVQD